MDPTPIARLPRIVGGTVTLRAFRPEDVDAVIDAATDARISPVTTVPTTPDLDLAVEWIERQHERPRVGQGYSFAIEAGEECVGQIGLWLRDAEHGRATIGYWIRPGRRGHGYAHLALRALSEWAWTIPGLHRLQLHIDPSNPASRRTAERAGFQGEGLLRSWQTIGGRRRDMLVYSLVRPVIAPGRVPEDIDPCVEIWIEALRARDGHVDGAAVAERTRAVFRRPLVRFAVAEQPLIGFAVTASKDAAERTTVLERLAVRPSVAGQGIGRALLSDAVDSARAARFETMELAVRRGNAAVRLYEAAGFRPVSAPVPHPLGGEPMITFRRQL